MASPIENLLAFLRILRSAKGHTIKPFSRWWASLLAYLGRKLGEWRCSRPSRPGTFGNPKQTDPSSPGGGAGSYSVAGGSACLSGYAVAAAASAVPPSANRPSLERTEWQPSTAPSSPNGSLARLPDDQTRAPSLNMTPYFHGGSIANDSTGNLSNLSNQSRASASDRLSIITNSRESSRGSVRNDQSSRNPKATYRQFKRGPTPSQSRGRLSPQPSSANLQDTTSPPPRLEVVTTTGPTHAHADEEAISPQSPAVAPSYTHESLSPPTNKRRRSSTSVIFNAQHPSTESLPITSATQPPNFTEEPMAMDPDPPTHSSPVFFPSNRLETASQHSLATSSSTADLFLPEGRFVQLINSDQIPRYTKNITISREGKLDFLEPLTTTFPYFPEPNVSDHWQASRRQTCDPWIPATHPDGALYFYDPVRRLFTDTDMHDPALKEEMDVFYSYMQKIVRVDDLTISSKDHDLVLDIMPNNDNEIQWSYYYACHETRCLFWLERYDLRQITSELDGVESPAHLKHRLEGLYWNHWSLFPVVFEGRRLPHRVYDELLGILAHGCIDMMTSMCSTLPYDDVQTEKMIRLVQNAKKAEDGVEHYTAGTTRLLSFFAHWRFLYFHGQRHARLVCGQTVYDEPIRKRSILISLLSPLLFLAPDVHLNEMEKVWVDEVIIKSAWRSYIDKLLEEWNSFVLVSTVMLAVNVGFPSIPGVIVYNTNGGTGPSEGANQMSIFASSSQIVSSFSTVASIGSIVIGLLLVRRNRAKRDVEPSEASGYLYQNTQKYFGLEMMAIIFSLPWALLMWSMVMFFIGLLLYCISISGLNLRISFASISVVMFAFIAGCIWTTWEPGNERGLLPGSITRALRPFRTLYRGAVVHLGYFKRSVVKSFRNCFHPDDVGSVHSLAGPRDGGGRV